MTVDHNNIICESHAQKERRISSIWLFMRSWEDFETL